MRIFSSVAVLVSVLAAAPAAAQDTPAWDMSGSYSFVRDQEIEQNLHGWLAAGTGHLNSWLGITGELGGNYSTTQVLDTDADFSVYSFMAGPRVSFRRQPNVTPYLQVLLGAARASVSLLGESASGAEFAIQPGGGVDIWMTPATGFRVGADYRRIAADEASNEFRFHVGMVLRGGSR